jgi:hypothetical protein
MNREIFAATDQQGHWRYVWARSHLDAKYDETMEPQTLAIAMLRRDMQQRRHCGGMAVQVKLQIAGETSTFQDCPFSPMEGKVARVDEVGPAG